MHFTSTWNTVGIMTWLKVDRIGDDDGVDIGAFRFVMCAGSGQLRLDFAQILVSTPRLTGINGRSDPKRVIYSGLSGHPLSTRLWIPLLLPT